MSDETGRIVSPHTSCTQCNAVITPEDAVYDDREARYFCDMPCFYDWADVYDEIITDFYVRMNVTGG